MSQENARDNTDESLESQNNNNGQSRGDSSTPASVVHQPNVDNQVDQAAELQRLRTEALERILMGSESNLSLPNPTARRLRLGSARRLRGQHRANNMNRGILSRNEIDRAIFIPFRTRGSISALSLPTSQDPTRVLNNIMGRNLNDGIHRQEFNRTGNNRPRINVSSFFMELTYSTAEPSSFLSKSSTEGQKRRLEIHATNTMNIIRQYCPVKPHKMNQLRCCIKTQRENLFNFQNVHDRPLDYMEPTQVKCNTKVIVIIREDPSGKWNSPFTPYLLNSLAKKYLNPTCITIQSEMLLNTLMEQLSDDLHVFPKNINAQDQAFMKQAKKFLLTSTLVRLLENWIIPLLILDSCISKIIDMGEIVALCKRFQIKLIEVEPGESSGGSKQRKAEARRVRHQIRQSLTKINMKTIAMDMKRRQENMSGIQTIKTNTNYDENINSTLINEDCRRIVFNLHEKMSVSLQKQQVQIFNKNGNTTQSPVPTPQISLLEDGILADIENSTAFKCSRNVDTPKTCRAGKTYIENGHNLSEKGESRPKTSYSISEENIARMLIPVTKAHCILPVLAREQEKVSELLFNELNQRWRVHGPQRFLPKTADAGPYCSGITETEKQLFLSILQEVTYFETLKDIRNELKDSKKDLEGRLYGFNPDFSNLIASAEEFLHGKASCMEPCQEEIQFYKMPVSLVLSEAEVKYLKSKPPVYIVGQESPNQSIKMAIEESTKLFTDAVIRTTCGAKLAASSRRNKTRAIIVVEDNNEVLELLTVALWFFEKTPLASFQSKYYHNTNEFLMSLDACRLYFRVYPSHSSKKDEEHIFERWLGVGMNGVLRSNQNKILLIDFPRPGMGLQNSKKILLNRLKIEEKLNNIKSLYVGKPCRKEDNLSTVERLLDEIQILLEPRDKLLFRKSRRMYMDLKLYKQIEQKSRQDLKALRDWGLPEPDNEHELWEKLRNSDLVINNPIPSRELDEPSSLLESESFRCFDESSEPESTLGGNEESSNISNKSHSDEAAFLSECEESMESVPNEYNPVFSSNQNHYMSALEFHANRNSSANNTTSPVVSNNADFPLVECGTCSFPDEIEVNPVDTQSTQNTKSNDTIGCNDHVLNEDTKLSPENLPTTHLRRSAGILNLLDKRMFDEKRYEVKNVQKPVGNCRLINTSSSSEVKSSTFTKLEFLLPPNLTSDEGSSHTPSALSLVETQANSDNENAVNKVQKSFPSDVKTTEDIESQDKNVREVERKAAPNLCASYMSKWRKSLSRMIKKKAARRIFPRQLRRPFTTQILKLETSTSTGSLANFSDGQRKCNQQTESRSSGSIQAIQESNERFLDNVPQGTLENDNSTWFHNLTAYFRPIKNFRRKPSNRKQN